MEAPTIPTRVEMLEQAFRAAGHDEADIPMLVAHNKQAARTILDSETGTLAILVALPGGGYATPVTAKAIQENRAARLAAK